MLVSCTAARVCVVHSPLHYESSSVQLHQRNFWSKGRNKGLLRFCASYYLGKPYSHSKCQCANLMTICAVKVEHCGLAIVVIFHTFSNVWNYITIFSSVFIFIIHGKIKSEVIKMNPVPDLNSMTKKPLLRNKDEFCIWPRFVPTWTTSDVT